MTDLAPENYMISVDDALTRVLSKTPTLGTEYCDVTNAEGRVLRENVKARITQPPNNVSAMDGYAFRHEDLENKGKTNLSLIGEAPAGITFEGVVGQGETIRIFTGACLPNSTDTVVMQENILKTDGGIEIQVPPLKGKNIRSKGSDFTENTILVQKGKRITSRDIGIITAGNVKEVLVSIKPKIGILSTGDELQLAGEVSAPSHIVNSNSPMLKNMIDKMGGEAIELGIARDNEASILEKAKQAEALDMLVTIGGASVGDYDIVAQTLEKLGFDIDFWKVAMRPGKPVIFGELFGPLLGLPGNPVSAMVAATLFLIPALEKFLDQSDSNLKVISAQLDGNLPENGTRQAYLRASLSFSNKGQIIVHPLGNQDSAALNSYTKSGCLIIREINSPSLSSGDICHILPLSPL